MIFSSGAVYEGQWQFDKMTGYGTLKLPDGTIQEGTWKDGSLHGCAVFTWPHGVAEYREYDASRGWFLLLFGFYSQFASRVTDIFEIYMLVLNVANEISEFP